MKSGAEGAEAYRGAQKWIKNSSPSPRQTTTSRDPLVALTVEKTIIVS